MTKISKVEYCPSCFAELDGENNCPDCDTSKDKFQKSSFASKCFATPDYKKMFAPSLEGKTWVRVKSIYGGKND